MNKAMRILTRHRLAYALCSTQPSTARSIHKQVTHLAHFSTRLPIKNQSLINFNSYAQRLFFSSKPDSSLDTLSSRGYPKFLEKELKGSKLKLSHESVVYELKKLSKDPINASKFLKWAVEREGFEPNSSIYSFILRILANKQFLKEFWVTINEMKEKGHYLDEETYRTICSTFRGLKMENEATNLRHFYKRLIQENAMEVRVKEVVDVIKSGGWGRKVESRLEEMKIEASDNLMLRVFKELRGKGSTLKAYNFFKWVERSLGFKHNGGVTYNGMLRVLCWEESILKFWEVLKEMKESGCEVDIDTYVKVSRQLQKNKMVEDCVKLYEHMMDGSYKPSERECNLLLRSIASDKPDIDLVRRVVNKYEASGSSFTKQLYDRIHRSLTSLGEFDEAEKIVEKMKNDGYELDNITYCQTVFGYCKARRFDEAAEVLDMMEEQGCKPEIKTWTILIKGHCAANEMEEALLCFTKMAGRGFNGDAELLDAFKLLVELVQREGLRPWQEMYESLIEKLLQQRKIKEAIELLRMMKNHNYPPYQEPFVLCISKSGSIEDAWEFLTALGGKEHPTVSAYQHVFRAFFDEGRHLEAKDLLDKCPKLIRKHPSISTMFGSANLVA